MHYDLDIGIRIKAEVSEADLLPVMQCIAIKGFCFINFLSEYAKCTELFSHFHRMVPLIAYMHSSVYEKKIRKNSSC